MEITVAENGLVVVVDRCNNRLVALDASLRNLRNLTLPIDGGLYFPVCFYFNDSLGQLYVGEQHGQCVVMWDNISFE